MTDRATVALAAHEEYRRLGYEPIPIRLDKITDDRGVDKKRPKFPGGTWKTAREIARDRDRLRSFVAKGYDAVALVCEGLSPLDFDRREDETEEACLDRARQAVKKYGLQKAVVERTGNGYHALLRIPPANGTPWTKRAWGPPHLVDEVQAGEGALLFVAPSWHPLAERQYERLTELRAVEDLPVCPVELLLPAPRPEPPARDAPVSRGDGARSRGDWSTLDVVGLFQAAGMYGKDLGGGKHGVRCPWETDHSTGSDGTDTVVYEASGAQGPGFRCLHAHCEGRGIRDVRDYFGTEEVDRWCVEEFRPTRGGEGTKASSSNGDARSPTDSPGKELTLTDTGNAARLIGLHGARLHYLPSWGRWIVCAPDGFYDIDHRDVQVRELAKAVGRQLKREAVKEPDSERAKKLFAYGLASLNARGIGGMVDLARGIEGIPLDHEELDRDGWLLGTENGVIELRTGEHRPARPADLMTMRCPVPWEADATAPRWERAIEEWFPDPEVRAYVQRVAGSVLVGAQRDHVFVIHFGLGGNGKGTFTRALQHVLGPLATEIHLSLLIQTKFSEHDTVKADLFRARLALAVETDKRVKLAEASVKNLTGGDRIRGRRMREDPWAFDPTHSLWLQTNHLPEITGRDTGIWRRIRVVKWERTFSDQDQDRDLDATLAAEAPGILRWLVQGCLDWQREGLKEPEAVIRATLEYRRREDVLSRFAADSELVFRPGLEIGAGELQDMLGRWAEEEGVDRPEGVTDWLREQGARRKQRRVEDGKRRKFWIGVGIEDGKHESEQEDAL
jgi:putative DNA primase/helicase